MPSPDRTDTKSAPDAQKPPKPKSPPPRTFEEYFSQAQASNPASFLRAISKGCVSIPTPESLQNIVTATDHESILTPRLLGLLQSIHLAAEPIKTAILSLAENLLIKNGHLAVLSERGTPPDCEQIALSLFSGKVDAPKDQKPDLLGVFLLLAYHREWISPSGAVALLQGAFFPPKTGNKQKKRTEPERPQSPEHLILTSQLKHGPLSPLLRVYSGWAARHADLDSAVRRHEATILELRESVASLQNELESAREQISSSEQIIEGKDTLIASLRKEHTESTTAWQHRYDGVRARLRGFMQGELTRWLQNATEAADADPPYLPVVQQRLRSALNGIQNELQWLSSD